MKEVSRYANILDIDEPIIHKNMAVAHLIGVDSGLDYYTLDGALRAGLKINESGNVPTLHFTNGSGKEVLIIQGEYVRGGMQNRMIENNIFMTKGFDNKVAVKCVQAGRWGYQPGRTSEYTPSEKRASPAVYRVAMHGQGAVWSEVDKLSMNLCASSETRDLDEVTEKRKDNIDEYVNRFSVRENAVGLVVAVNKNGKLFLGTDIFDQSKTLKENYKKIIESYALEAINSGSNVELSRESARSFLANLENCDYQIRNPVSLGIDARLTKGNELEGSVLSYDGRPLYINLASKISISPGGIINPRYQTGFRRTWI